MGNLDESFLVEKNVRNLIGEILNKETWKISDEKRRKNLDENLYKFKQEKVRYFGVKRAGQI